MRERLDDLAEEANLFGLEHVVNNEGINGDENAIFILEHCSELFKYRKSSKAHATKYIIRRKFKFEVISNNLFLENI